MATDLNFESESLLNENAFVGEAEEEWEVRDHRSRTGGARPPVAGRPGARVRFAPGFGGGPGVRRGAFFRGPAFRPGPFGRPRGGFGFRGGSGLRRPFGFGPRFGRFGRPRWGWLSGGLPFGGMRGAGAMSMPGAELVSWAQGCLAQITGEPLPQNGILGGATRRALAAFQTQQQLAATGVLDNQTISALQAACAEGGAGDTADAGGQ